VFGRSRTSQVKTAAAERRVKGDLERFKQLIESRGLEVGGRRGEVDQAQVVTR
jgi:hypothetical protein